MFLSFPAIGRAKLPLRFVPNFRSQIRCERTNLRSQIRTTLSLRFDITDRLDSPISWGESVFGFVAKPSALAAKGGRGSARKSRGFPPIGNPIWRYIPKGPFDGGSACGVVWKRRDLPARTILLVDPFGGIEQKADFANCCSPFAKPECMAALTIVSLSLKPGWIAVAKKTHDL